MDDRLKNLEIEIAYLRKEIAELKKMRTTEIHTHYTTILKTDNNIDDLKNYF